jgi:hypothetical protein
MVMSEPHLVSTLMVWSKPFTRYVGVALGTVFGLSVVPARCSSLL